MRRTQDLLALLILAAVLATAGGLAVAGSGSSSRTDPAQLEGPGLPSLGTAQSSAVLAATPVSNTVQVPTLTATIVPTAAAVGTPVAAAPVATPTTPAVGDVPVTGWGDRSLGMCRSARMTIGKLPTAAQPLLLEPLVDPSLDLSAPAVEVPLTLRIPSLRIDAPVLAVGITSDNVMDAPQGSADDPVWDTAFWYRGGGIPGDPGTATIAGHVDGIRGRPALFAKLKEVQPGDLIIVHDSRTNLDVWFSVTEVVTYSVRQANEASVLARIYGAGPVAGERAEGATDGLSHLTLITCSGSWVQGSYDHRLVVYAQRTPAMP